MRGDCACDGRRQAFLTRLDRLLDNVEAWPMVSAASMVKLIRRDFEEIYGE